MSENVIFTTADSYGRAVTLRRDTFEDHIQINHPEVSIEAIKTTIEQPNLIYESSLSPQSDIYYKLGAEPSFPGLYCKVVARFSMNMEGEVSTAFYTREIGRVGGLKHVDIRK